MIKILEIKETLEDTPIIDNIYAIRDIIEKIIQETEFVTNLNQEDYNYINIIFEKTKINLKKTYYLIKHQ